MKSETDLCADLDTFGYFSANSLVSGGTKCILTNILWILAYNSPKFFTKDVQLLLSDYAQGCCRAVLCWKSQQIALFLISEVTQVVFSMYLVGAIKLIHDRILANVPNWHEKTQKGLTFSVGLKFQLNNQEIITIALY